MTTFERLIVDYATARHMLGGVGKTKFHELVKQGKFKRVWIGSKPYLETESVHAFIATLERE